MFANFNFNNTGVYESFETICIYLESDQSVGSDPEKNFWVRYRLAIVNQKNPSKTEWKESSICTKTWNNSVLQFMKVSEVLESDAGLLVRDTVVFVCEILDCCPWFEFEDLEVSIMLLEFYLIMFFSLQVFWERLFSCYLLFYLPSGIRITK